MKEFVAVRTRYHKIAAAIAVLDHVHSMRNGFTCSQNVLSAYSHNNVGVYAAGAKSALEAMYIMCDRYQNTTGKKCRSDFNVMFEHILILSEERYSFLEQKHGADRVKQACMHYFKQYAQAIKKEFGFEPMGIDLHFDEGIVNPIDGQFKRNIHCHITYFNYDFERKKAPLRHLMRKGFDDNGRINQLNPNFVKMQDIAGDIFGKMGFKRGVSRSVTGIKHENKELFVRKKMNEINLTLEKSVSLEKVVQERLQDAKDQLDITEEKLAIARTEFQALREKIEEGRAILSEIGQAIKAKTLVMMRHLATRLKSSSPKLVEHSTSKKMAP